MGAKRRFWVLLCAFWGAAVVWLVVGVDKSALFVYTGGMAVELSVREAAELTGYNPDHIYRLLEAGKVKGRKVVTVWLVEKESILAYLEKMKEDPRGGPKKKKTA